MAHQLLAVMDASNVMEDLINSGSQNTGVTGESNSLYTSFLQQLGVSQNSVVSGYQSGPLMSRDPSVSSVQVYQKSNIEKSKYEATFDVTATEETTSQLKDAPASSENSKFNDSLICKYNTLWLAGVTVWCSSLWICFQF